MAVKKTLPLAIATLALTLSLISCKKDILNPTNALQTKCENLSQDFLEALQTLSSDPTPENCEAYKTALRNYVNGCSAFVGYNASYEDEIESLDCSDYGN